MAPKFNEDDFGAQFQIWPKNLMLVDNACQDLVGMGVKNHQKLMDVIYIPYFILRFGPKRLVFPISS